MKIAIGRIAITLAAILIIACNSKVDPFHALVKQDDLKGKIDRVSLSIDKKSPKVSKCGYMLQGTANVPYNTTREKTRTTLLSLLTRIHQQDTNCDWIDVWLYTEGGIKNGFQIGKASYKNGSIELMFFIPSDEQLAAPHGKGYPLTPIRLPAFEEFTLGAKIESEYHKVYGAISEGDLKTVTANSRLDRSHDVLLDETKGDRAYKKLALELKMEVTEVRRIRELCNSYYDLWDTEVLNP